MECDKEQREYYSGPSFKVAWSPTTQGSWRMSWSRGEVYGEHVDWLEIPELELLDHDGAGVCVTGPGMADHASATDRVNGDLIFGLCLDLLELLLKLLKSPHVEFYPLASIGDSRILQESTENHEETHSQVDIKSLHVGDFGKGTVNNHLASKLFEYFPPVDRAH